MNITTYDGPLLPDLFNGYDEIFINDVNNCSEFDTIISQPVESCVLVNNIEIDEESRTILGELKSCLKRCGESVTQKLQIESLDNNAETSSQNADLYSPPSQPLEMQSSYTRRKHLKVNIDTSNYIKQLCSRVPESLCVPAKSRSTYKAFYKGEVDCETAQSKLLQVDIKNLLSLDNFDKLTNAEKFNLIQMLPACDREILNKGFLRINGDFIKSEHFQNAIKQFTFLLKSGAFQPKKSGINVESSDSYDIDESENNALDTSPTNANDETGALSREYLRELKFQISCKKPLEFATKYGRHRTFTSSPRRQRRHASDYATPTMARLRRCCGYLRTQRVNLSRSLCLLRRLSTRYDVVETRRRIADMLTRVRWLLGSLQSYDASTDASTDAANVSTGQMLRRSRLSSVGLPTASRDQAKPALRPDDDDDATPSTRDRPKPTARLTRQPSRQIATTTKLLPQSLSKIRASKYIRKQKTKKKGGFHLPRRQQPCTAKSTPDPATSQRPSRLTSLGALASLVAGITTPSAKLCSPDTVDRARLCLYDYLTGSRRNCSVVDDDNDYLNYSPNEPGDLLNLGIATAADAIPVSPAVNYVTFVDAATTNYGPSLRLKISEHLTNAAGLHQLTENALETIL